MFNIGNLKVYGIIYGIKNKLNGKWYIGQTKTYNGIEDLVQRRKEDKITTDSPFMLAVALKDTNEMIGEIVVMPSSILLLV